jgi:hypothetical protein
MLGRFESSAKSNDGGPRIEKIMPAAALPGADVRIEGRSFRPPARGLPQVRMAGLAANVIISSDRVVVARVPEGAISGSVQILYPNDEARVGNGQHLEIGVPIAENLHPVANPALDPEGNIYTTLSGPRGQKVPVSLYRIDSNYTVKPFSSAIVNPTGLAFDREGVLYVSSRADGTVYRVAANGTVATWAEGMGIATGLAFDRDQNLYVGDRSGTIFKIDRKQNTFVFATLEPSVAAYHLAFSEHGDLYVTGATLSGFDTVWRVRPTGEVDPFFRGLGRPQGLAFDANGDLFVVGSLHGRRGVVRITPAGEAQLAISALNLVGLAFARGPALILATHTGLFHLDWPVAGRTLPPHG